MSILQSTYDLCKAIKKLSTRDEVKRLIKELNTSTPGSITSSSDRSEFGYIARNRNLEFLGYLITHEQRDKIKELIPVFNFQPLEDSEILLLETCHNLIMRTDKECLAPLVKIFPNSQKAINAYYKFPYTLSHNISYQFDEISEEISKLVSEFKNHKSYTYISNNISKFPKLLELPEDQLLMTMIGYNREFLKRDHNSISEDAKKILELTHSKGEHSTFIKITLSLLCIRSSIRLINKFIYLSFIKDKLGLLNNDNVFNIKSNFRNVIGDFLTLESQPMDDNLFINPTEPILVKLELNDHKIDSLYFVEGISLSFMNEFGDNQTFELRKIDDNLNLFTNFYYT